MIKRGSTVVRGDQISANSSSSTSIVVTITSLLALCILSAGIYTAIRTALIVHGSFSPVVDWDQWQIVDDMMQSGGHPPVDRIWAQHNEHRIPFGRLAGYADLKWFGGRNVSLLIENYLSQALAVLLFAWILRRLGKLSGPAYMTAIGFMTFCMFFPIQIDNFCRGFQITFVLCFLAACFSFATAAAYEELGSGTRFIPGPLIASLLGAIVAELSLLNGLLVWPVLILLAYSLKFPKRAQIIIAATGAAAISAYLWRFHMPKHNTTFAETIRHPIAIAEYLLTYFGSTWGAIAWLTPIKFGTGLALVAVAIGAAKFFIMPVQPNRLRAFLFANMVFLIATATITSLGRIDFGIAQAASSRYQTVSLWFWASFAALVLQGIDSRKNWAKLIGVQLFILFLLM